MDSTRTSILKILRNANSSVSVLRSCGNAHAVNWQPCWPRDSREPARSSSERPTDARPGAQHAAGNLDNRHVEIVCAASALVNVSVTIRAFDAATRLDAV